VNSIGARQHDHTGAAGPAPEAGLPGDGIAGRLEGEGGVRWGILPGLRGLITGIVSFGRTLKTEHSFSVDEVRGFGMSRVSCRSCSCDSPSQKQKGGGKTEGRQAHTDDVQIVPVHERASASMIVSRSPDYSCSSFSCPVSMYQMRSPMLVTWSAMRSRYVPTRSRAMAWTASRGSRWMYPSSSWCKDL